MKKLSFATVAMFALLSITLVSCSAMKEKLPMAKQLAADKITSVIVEEGQCQYREAVQADVEDFLRIEKIDTTTAVESLQADAQAQGFAVGAVVSPICQAAVKAIIPSLLDKASPAKWGCSIANLKSKAVEIASSACEKI